MKKVFVKKDDYDLYSIRLPLRFLFGRKRRGYIARELEKVHPNYSSSTSAEDMRLSFGRKGIFADVAVVDRALLSSYMSESKLARKKLFLEGKPERKVFVGEKSNLFRVVLIPLSLFVVVFAFRYSLSFMKDSDSKNVIAVGEKNEIGEKSTNEKSSAALLAPQELFAAVLASVRAKHGRVTSLSWKDGRCSFAVTGCNSEDIAAANYCVVSYSSGQPQFNFVTKVNDRLALSDSAFSDSESFFSDEGKVGSFGEKVRVENIVPVVRKEIVASGGDILSEKVSESDSSVSFACESEKFAEIVSAVSRAVNENGWRECAVSVDSDGLFSSVCISFKNCGAKSAFRLSSSSSSVSDSSDFDNPLAILSEYGDVFGNGKSLGRKTEKSNGKVVRQKSLLVADSAPSSNRVRIGEIRKGGSTFVYYRSSDGRVSSEVVNAE